MDMHRWPERACGPKSRESLARLLGDLAHPLRLALVRHLLAEGEECVCSLARRHGVDQPTLSRHLRILKDHTVLADRREGGNVLDRVVDPRVAPLLDSLGVLKAGARFLHYGEEKP